MSKPDTKEKEANKFPDLSLPSDMIKYLDDSTNRLKNSKFLHHYTTLDNFIAMMRSNSLHLANAKDMNDKLEYNNGDKERWKNIYFSSFMAEDKESIAMWSMYAQPWSKGVKIAIPSSIVRKWIKNVTQLNIVENYINTGEIIAVDNNQLKLSSVVYSNAESFSQADNEKIQWSNTSNKNFKSAHKIKEFTGYVKDMAWSYEKELRIKAEINNDLSIDRLSVELTEEVINSMVITASPLFDGDLISEIQKEIGISFQLEASLFKDRLNIKTICDSCDLKAKIANN